MKLDSKIPEGPLAQKWSKHKFNLKLVNPANKRKYTARSIKGVYKLQGAYLPELLKNLNCHKRNAVC